MKMAQRFSICFLIGILVSGKLLAAAPDEILFRSHFAGTTAAAGQSPKLKEIFALPQSTQLRDDVLQKLARASLKFIGNAAQTNQAALLKPVLQDLISTESIIELRGQSSLELFVAAKLSDARSKVWESDMGKLVKGPKQLLKVESASGWQAKGNLSSVIFLREGKWTIVVLAAEQSAATADFVKRLRAVSAGKNLLAADVNWPKLQRWVPLDFIPLKPARTDIKVEVQGENLRSEVRVVYPEKIDWKQERWEIPNDAIRDPLISFTAAQKLAPFLKPVKTFQQLSFNPLTNQFYFWAQSQMPFQTYFASPVKSATNVMRKLGPELIATYNPTLKKRDGGTLHVGTNKIDIIWQGLPIIVPYLVPAKEKDGSEFLFGGFFPLVRSTNVPPAELFSQVTGDKNLVFYDWEVTQPRLSQWLITAQLLPLFGKDVVKGPDGTLRPIPPKVPEQKWLSAIGPKLGNTITQVTYKSPNELNIVRKSHIGFNSIELVLLSHWLAHPQFPSFNPFASANIPAGQTPTPAKPKATLPAPPTR